MGKDTISGVIPGSGADGVLGPDPRISDRDQSRRVIEMSSLLSAFGTKRTLIDCRYTRQKVGRR